MSRVAKTLAVESNSSGKKGIIAAPPAMPTTQHPLTFAIWRTTAPTAPAAAETTTVSLSLRPANIEQATSKLKLQAVDDAGMMSGEKCAESPQVP
jgi:hypothetical protein